MSKLLFMLFGLLLGAGGMAYYAGLIPDWCKAPSKEPPGAALVPAKPAEAAGTGMVEAAGGEIDVFAQMPGRSWSRSTFARGQERAKGPGRGRAGRPATGGRNRLRLAAVDHGAGQAQAHPGRRRQGGEARGPPGRRGRRRPIEEYETSNRDRLRSSTPARPSAWTCWKPAKTRSFTCKNKWKACGSITSRSAAGRCRKKSTSDRAEVAQEIEKPGQAKVNFAYRMVYAPIAGARSPNLPSRGRFGLRPAADADRADGRCGPPPHPPGDRRGLRRA